MSNVIRTVNSVWTKIDPELSFKISKYLSYQDSYWKFNRRLNKKEQITYTVSMIQKFKDGQFFLTGLVPKVLAYCKSNHIAYQYISDLLTVEHDEPSLPGIVFRDYQSNFIYIGLKYGRGVFTSATGTGKSILIAGLVSAFSQENILFLVHTQDLIDQMAKDLEGFGFTIGIWTGTTKQISRITIATIQSFSRIAQKHINTFDVVFVDECHHCNSLTGQYGKTLQILNAPVKIGTTGTLPTSEKGLWSLEALIGPVLMDFSVNEGIEQGVLAKPQIIIRDVEDLSAFEIFDDTQFSKIKENEQLSKFQIVYQNCIVKHKARNLDILQLTQERVNQNCSVLINVIRIDHIKTLIELQEKYFPELELFTVYGNIGKDERMRIKTLLEEKTIKAVVASTVWSEGLNIKSLDTCILAGGLKSDIKLFQNIGRGLRKTKDKNHVVVYDFADTSHKYVKNHYQQRKKVYQELGWL